MDRTLINTTLNIRRCHLRQKIQLKFVHRKQQNYKRHEKRNYQTVRTIGPSFRLKKPLGKILQMYTKLAKDLKANNTKKPNKFNQKDYFFHDISERTVV